MWCLILRTTQFPEVPILSISDGLTDCVDPDCCQQSNCFSSPLCQGSPDPLDLIQHSQPPFSQHPPRLFYDRIRFLIGKESTHVIPGDVNFESRWVFFSMKHFSGYRELQLSYLTRRKWGYLESWDGSPPVLIKYLRGWQTLKSQELRILVIRLLLLLPPVWLVEMSQQQTLLLLLTGLTVVEGELSHTCKISRGSSALHTVLTSWQGAEGFTSAVLSHLSAQNSWIGIYSMMNSLCVTYIWSRHIIQKLPWFWYTLIKQCGAFCFVLQVIIQRAEWSLSVCEIGFAL